MVKKSVEEWRQEFIQGLNEHLRRDQLDSFIRFSWLQRLPDFLSGGAQPIRLKYDLQQLDGALLEPIEAFIVGSDKYEDKFASVKENDLSNVLCNKCFGHGEPTYSCRDCAVDQTCVLCMDCFKQSAHKNHRYKISSSSGGGFCDCGDPEAWKSDFACATHQPPTGSDVNIDLEDARKRLPSEVFSRFAKVIECALCYAYQFLTISDNDAHWPEEIIQQSDAKQAQEFEFVTILYNDETHTYDQVINTLTRTLECTQEEALEYATMVDHEGRSPIKFGSNAECDRVKSFVERNSRRPQPLRLEVVLTTVYIHQVFALRVLAWIRKLAETCEGFKAAICDVCLQVSHATNDLPIVSALLLNDSRMWKAARNACHMLFMSTFLSFGDAKMEFARLFARLYPQLMTAFIADDHDHSDSCTSLSVQLFTVPTVARTLFSDKLVEIIIKSFVLVLQTRRDEHGRLSFDRSTQPPGAGNLKRALYILYDSRYLLNRVPAPEQWTESLRKGFLGGFDEFLNIMNMMEGMDGHVRRTQSHVEYETDWEQPFNIQLRMGPIISQLQEWCASDEKVLASIFDKLVRAALDSLGSVDKLEKKEVARFVADCIEYDVAANAVSIHHPVIRMLAGVAVHALQKNVFVLVDRAKLPAEQHLRNHAREIAEFPLRTMVLVAQANAGMWRRNGYALANQIFFYQQPRCRQEMLDKDVVLLQVCAAVSKPNDFLINALNKFGLISWADEIFDATPLRTEDDSIRQVMFLAEEFLYFLIVLVGERFCPHVGQVSEDDCLENEIIHQLSMSSVSYSDLIKSLPDQDGQSSILEDVTRKVAFFKRPSASSKGIFELKPEFASRYNMFFYHFTRIEHSKAEDTQRKRKKKDGEEIVFPPPCPPEFSAAFQSVINLLDCDVFIHLVNLTIRRAVNQHPRSFSEGQLIRVLYLIGYALHEEKRCREGQRTGYSFLEKSADVGIFAVLRELKNQKDNDSYRGMVQWVLRFYESLTNPSPGKPEENQQVSAESSVDDVEERRRMAALRRDRIMQQMKLAQSSFATQNVGELEEIILPESDSKSPLQPMPVAKPAAVGPHQNLSSVVADEEKHTCILCSESHAVMLSSEPFVVVAYVQRSTVLSQEDRACGNATLAVSAPTSVKDICSKLMPCALLLPASLSCAPHVSSCGHLLHSKCWKAYFDSVVARERRRSIRLRTNTGSFDITKNEFRCPLCSRLCNAAMPLFQSFVQKEDCSTGVIQAPQLEFDVFLDGMRSLFQVTQSEMTDECPSEIGPLDFNSRLLPQFVSGQSQASAASLQTVVRMTDRLNGIDVKNSEQLSDGYLEALRTFQNQVYQVALNTAPSPISEAECCSVSWAACSYTIQNTEMILRLEKKPLLGSFTSRQYLCLKSLIKSACWTSSIYEPKTLMENALRIFAGVFIPSSFFTGGHSLFTLDCFTLLLNCLSYFPWLPWSDRGLSPAPSESSFYRPPVGDSIDHSLLIVVYVVHVLQVLSHFRDDSTGVSSPSKSLEEDSVLREIFSEMRRRNHPDGEPVEGKVLPENFELKIRHAVWPFLRSVAIFFHFVTGVDGPESLNSQSDLIDEQFDDLMHYLSLPSSMTQIVHCSNVLQQLINRWLDEVYQPFPSINLRFPRPFPSFMPLPHDYIDIITRASRFRSCRVEVDERRSPAMCLVCGELLCSQSMCCQFKLDNINVGACTLHSATCGAGTGIFLRVRENQILLLHGTNKGSFAASPYVDVYGEPDAFLRRGNPLHLSEERLEQLLRLYVHHDVADEVSHAMDQNGSLAGLDWHHF